MVGNVSNAVIVKMLGISFRTNGAELACLYRVCYAYISISVVTKVYDQHWIRYVTFLSKKYKNF